MYSVQNQTSKRWLAAVEALARLPKQPSLERGVLLGSVFGLAVEQNTIQKRGKKECLITICIFN